MFYASEVSVTAASATPSTVTAGTTGVNEVQRVTLVGTSGSFTITYDAVESDPIFFPLDEDQANDAISGLGGGDIVATVTSATTLDLEFTGALAATNVAQVTADDAGLVNATLIAVGQGDTALCHCVYLHTEGTIAVGGIDTPFFPVPDITTTQALEVDLVYKEELYANGSGTLYLLETGLSHTPDL